MTGLGTGSKPRAPADRAAVAVEGGGLGATGEVEVLQPVVVTVEGRHPAADEVHEVPVVSVLEHAGLLDEPRRRQRLGPRRRQESGKDGQSAERDDRRADPDDDPAAPDESHEPH